MNNLPGKEKTSKSAIASTFLGIVTLFILTIFIIDITDWDFFRSSHFLWLQNISGTLGDWKILICAVMVVLDLLFGWIGIVKINNSSNLRGKPLAIFGLICGGIFILFFLSLAIVFFATGFK